MKTNKQLDKELGIKHIGKPSDLPKTNEPKEADYKDPEYPYESEYTKLPPKRKKRTRVTKRSAKRRVEKPGLLKRVFTRLFGKS